MPGTRQSVRTRKCQSVFSASDLRKEGRGGARPCVCSLVSETGTIAVIRLLPVHHGCLDLRQLKRRHTTACQQQAAILVSTLKTRQPPRCIALAADLEERLPSRVQASNQARTQPVKPLQRLRQPACVQICSQSQLAAGRFLVYAPPRRAVATPADHRRRSWADPSSPEQPPSCGYNRASTTGRTRVQSSEATCRIKPS